MIRVALAGNPNAGKTTIFNALTGLRQKIANYPGITVEKKIGRAVAGTQEFEILDLPGTYSLVPASPDEAVSASVLKGERSDTPAPDVIVAVVDASTLARGLFLVSQLMELGRPLVVALNMTDIADRRGRSVDPVALADRLGVPVVPLVGNRKEGVGLLLGTLASAKTAPKPSWSPTADGDPVLAEVAGRYAWVDVVTAACVRVSTPRVTISERIDHLLLHPAFGFLTFALIMAGLFVTLFTLASPLMDACQNGVTALGAWLTSGMADGDLKSLINDGIFAGVGGVVVFVPQIALLFLFLSLLEDSGYLARAAFLMDRVLHRVGLHGKSFIPLLSSFACAIPGIISTRTIEAPRERIATILVAPLMSCSARLPVYALAIAAFFGHWAPWQQGMLMLGLYVLGIVAAFAIAWVAMKIRGRAGTSPLLLELPAYKVPQASLVLNQVWHGTSAFLTRAGSIILALSIVIWAMTTYPKPHEDDLARAEARFHQAWKAPDGVTGDDLEAQRSKAQERYVAQAALEHSVAGRLGHAIEPVIAPLGFDWKIGVGLVGAFAAREVFVSTLGIVYAVGGDEEDTADLQAAIRADRRADGTPVWTTATAASLLVWFVLAMQCISTTAVVRRETGSWGWALGQLVGFNVLAWVAAFLTWNLLR